MSSHKREEELVVNKVLSNDGTVSGLVSTRVYPDQAPEGSSVPYVVIHRIVGTEEKAKGGVEPTKETRLQVDCFAGTKDGANDLADGVESALKGYSGTTYGTITVVSIYHDTDNPSGFDRENRLYRTSDDYTVKVKV